MTLSPVTLTADATTEVGGTLPAGTCVDRFEIVQLLGSGGSADVYEAEHLDLGRRVALKIVRCDGEVAHDTLERFRREARTVGALHHPHIADVFHVGHTETGEPFLVMELLLGETLDAWIERGPLRVEAAVEVARELLEALAFVHEAGVLHRDVKPQNLVIHRESSGELMVKLVDFGISKRPEVVSADRAITRDGLLVGTPHYMAPETMAGVAASAATDVYAAGVVLYECLAGRPPWDAPSVSALIAAVLRDDPPSLAELRPDVPTALVEIVTKAIARDPAARFPTARALREALDAVVVQLALPTGLAALDPAAAMAMGTSRSSGIRRSRPSTPLPLSHPRAATPRRGRALALGAVVLAAVIAVWLAAVVGGGPQRADATSATHDVAPRKVVAAATPPPPSTSASFAATAPVPSCSDEPRHHERTESAHAVPAPAAASARIALHAAVTAYANGQFPRAQALFRAAVRADPALAEAWRGLGAVSATMGQPTEARHAYQRYLALAPRAADSGRVRTALNALR